MLRIKQIIDELRLPQQTVANLTGWSKTQISITFNSGEFPKDAERFRASIRAFVEITQPILDWLAERSLPLDAVFDNVAAPLPAEIPGTGPVWACAQYGQPGHDYYTCRDCLRHFDGHMKRQHGRAAVMGGVA